MFIRKYLVIIILLVSVSALKAQAQLNDYSKEWKKVNDFASKGLPKSALEEISNIYVLAKKENNDPQVIKALIYKVLYSQNIQEDATAKSIREVEAEITQSHEPAKSILNSLLAEMYQTALQRNRYKLYSVTKTVNFKKDDINTWAINDYTSKISDLYVRSLKEEHLLKQTKLEPFDPIISKGNARFLRPTLFDLLAHRALDYFKNTERDVDKPSYAFEIKDEKAFAPAQEFAQHKFINKDSASLYYQAVLIFQDLLLFHEKDANPEALIDADIERINFMKQQGVMENKTTLYINALEKLQATYKNEPATAQAGFLVAQEIYSNAAAKDQKQKQPDNGYTVKSAKEKAESIVKQFPESEGGINAKNLITQILHKDLTITIEKVNVPGQPMRSLITYKNLFQLHLRIISVTPELMKSLKTNYNDALWKTLLSQNPIRSWKQSLPVTDDYLGHSTEIKVDALPVGEYAIIASAAEDFNIGKNPLSAIYFYVSDISFIDSGDEYFILNRETGKPLVGAKVQVWLQGYDYATSSYLNKKAELLTADIHGYVAIEKKENQQRNFRLEITYKDDRLFMDDQQYQYSNYNNVADQNTTALDYERNHARAFLFTDRSIYRPGQLVYFKGIAITNDFTTRRSKLFLVNDPILVWLKDANSQVVDSLKLSQNEYGSFSGKFRLPENKLNGQFTIEVISLNNSQTSFSVEEYKRPKFYTEFEKVKGTYKVNEKIKITGFAKAYAGNNIDGAKVTYRVTREARFLYPWMWWRWRMPLTTPMEIAHGETKTGIDGKFDIEFEAIPDLTLDKNNDPVFDYKVEADVTDINGETRSSSATVPVGYKALNLQITLPSTDAIPVDSLKSIYVSTKNLSGEFERSKVELKIYKLQTPQRLIRKRYWAQPDEFVMSKEEFLKSFPNDEYKDELTKETWPKGDLVFTMADSTSMNSKFKIQTLTSGTQASKFTQGWYVVEATAKDKYGQEVKDVKYFELYDMNQRSLAAPAYSWTTTINNTVEPGNVAKFVSGTSANDVYLIQQVDRPEIIKPAIPHYEFQSLNSEKKLYSFPVTEKDRGGFGVFNFFVKDNRYYSNSWNVSVPWTNKDLKISFDTYRDKTLPGSEEKWKVKISGNKGEKVAAEMMAGMYDASLDQFKPHSWSSLNIWPNYYGSNRWAGLRNFTTSGSFQRYIQDEYIPGKPKTYDQLLSIGGGYMNREFGIRGMSTIAADNLPAPAHMKLVKPGEASELLEKMPGVTADNDGEVFIGGRIASKQEGNEHKTQGESPSIDQSQIQIRKNFNETAFFYPELRTDKDGNIEFSFTMPEALTQWKLMAFAHTKDLSSGYNQKMVITQKDLMIQPNPPRFLREGDKMEFTAKIVNVGDKPLEGQAELHLLNASTMIPVDGWFKNTLPGQHFTVASGQSTVIKFNIEIPYNYNNAVVYRIVAKAGEVSDGEEAAIPVLTNRMLVTETMPLPVRGSATKSFTFEKLLHAGNSSTLTHHALTVEYTTNPAWYAVQALPYLMEYPYECAEQTFNRYYANSIASKIVNSSPKIKAIFEKWKDTDTSALLSNLQKNQELKSVLLEETPWVLEAQNESQQKKNIALLFDMVKMSSQLESAITKLKDMQVSNGGFVWFKGGVDDRYMTQYIITGMGHLKHLNAFMPSQEGSIKTILSAAIPYLDRKLKEDYDYLIKYKIKLDQNNLGYIAIQYLYMRSFFPEYPIAAETQTAYNYYRDQEKKYWLNQSKYMQAMIALNLYRTKDAATPSAILRSLKENAIVNEELGMYWKEWNNGGYWWYQAPIESQAMMIEAFNEISKDVNVVDDLKTWLLKNKQTTNWKTTKATAEACYALLLQGTDWLSEEKNVTIKLGNKIINSKDENQEAGTGYFKKIIEGSTVTPDMGNIAVTVSTPVQSKTPTGASWGAVYWQYFENLDKITFAETPLKLSKKLFIEKNTDRGPVITPVEEGTLLKVGDKIKVRIELRVDREMEYVHMKDMRASCMEPVNVISEYKYQGGLGYYETTKDASTNFFFGWLPKGTYVFEYPMFVTHSGNFSNGITSIQCMYAPEFTAHSEGVRVSVSE